MDGNLLIHIAGIGFGIAFLSIFMYLFFIKTLSIKVLGIYSYFAACSCLIMSFLSLLYSYSISDMSLINVALNSHVLMPIYYKMAAVWGNHEGSMLLLTTYFTITSIIFYRVSHAQKFALHALLIQISINLVFVVFIIQTSNPFIKVFPMPTGGLGLNPTLQDFGLIIHPPILYFGHASCAIIYTIILSCCGEYTNNKQWLHHVKPWIILALSFLTLGIGLGSWWAYKEIGWGGFWFWDPVENISLFPWLIICTMLHFLMLTQRVGTFTRTTQILGIAAFLSILLSIFVVRSGLLQSVHSFAKDSDRGVILFYIFLLYTSYGCLKISYNVKKTFLKTTNVVHQIIIYSSIITLLSLFIIMLGTFFPLYEELLNNKAIIITPNFFNYTFNIIELFNALLCISAIYFLNYKKDLFINILITIIVISCIFILLPSKEITITILDISAIIGLIIGMYLMIQSLIYIYKNTNKAYQHLSHCAFGLCILAISCCALFSYDEQLLMHIGETKDSSNFKITLNDVYHKQYLNYLTKTADITIQQYQTASIKLTPELRIFPIEKQVLSKPSIYRNIMYDLHVNISQINELQFLLTFNYRPMINFLWLSTIIIFITTFSYAIRLFRQLTTHSD